MKAHRISFKQIENWNFPNRKEYQYEWITNKEIENKIASDEVREHRLEVHWYCYGSSSTTQDNPITMIKPVLPKVLPTRLAVSAARGKPSADGNGKSRCGAGSTNLSEFS